MLLALPLQEHVSGRYPRRNDHTTLWQNGVDNVNPILLRRLTAISNGGTDRELDLFILART